MNRIPANARLPLLVLLPLALALQGCRGGPFDPGSARDELRAARARWESLGIRDYRFTLRNTCFCPPEIAGPVRVEVRGGQTVSVTPVDPSLRIREEVFAGTVEGLFAAVEDAISRGPDALKAAYDPVRGHPVTLEVDHARNAIDDEYGFVVRDFERLP